METYQVDIINPKAKKLLKNLEELKLISLNKNKNDFLDFLDSFREKQKYNPISLKEITQEVEIVRSQRYGENK